MGICILNEFYRKKRRYERRITIEIEAEEMRG